MAAGESTSRFELQVIRYPYLDAARICAALAVYAFHAEVPGFNWGYIGVDFFMVLSGFVVTAAVLNSGGTTLPLFLRARMSRLFPGMIVFLAVAAAVLLSFGSFSERLQSVGYILPSGLYYSNWYSIFAADNYFNQNNINVFIHIWSLAVEEQFYLVFALVLLAPARFHTGIKLAAFVVLCFWLYQRHTQMSADRFYFGTDSRAVQFLAGSLLAHGRLGIARIISRVPIVIIIAAAAAIGAVAVLYSVDDADYFFRGYLAASVASVLFLLVSIKGHKTKSTRNGWVGILGHASYTQYLLHMPLIFVLSKITVFDLPWKIAGAAMLVAVSAMVSNWIEAPVQKLLRRARPRWVLIVMPAVLLSAAGGAYWAVKYSVPAVIRNSDLTFGYSFCEDLSKPCLRAGKADAPVILLLGDSTGSAVLDGALRRYVGAHDNLAFVTAVLPNCAIRERLSVAVQTGKPAQKHKLCLQLSPKVLAAALNSYSVERVIVASVSDGLPLLAKTGGVLRSDNARWKSEAVDGAMSALSPIREAGIPITFVMVPQWVPLPDCLAGSSCESSRDARRERVLDVYRDVSKPSDSIVDLNDVFCNGERCPLIIDGMITRYDGVHFTRAASEYFSSTIVQSLGID